MNILITGASKGIGYEVALYLARTGAHNIIAVARQERLLDKLRDQIELESSLSKLLVCPMDLQEGDYSSLLQWLQQLGSLDAILANAGGLIHKSFMETSTDEWNQMLQLNLLAQVSLLQNCYPYLCKAPGSPHVVLIGSMGGMQGSKKFPGLAAYSVSKGALAVLGECLAEEWKQDHIQVNTLCLGAVNTDMLSTAFPGYIAPVSAAEMGKFIGNFLLEAGTVMSGKIIPVSLSDPD